MKKLVAKFRLFFVVSIVLFGLIFLYPLVVLLCFIGNDKVSKAIVELINKSLAVISLLVWLKSISEK